MIRPFLGLAMLLAPPLAAAAPIRLWSEVAEPPMGATTEALAAKLRRAKLKKVKIHKPKGVTALREKVSFEGHTPAHVTYRFFTGKLYEVELQYLKGGRTKKVASFLRKRFGKGKKRGAVRFYSSGARRIAFRIVGGRVRITVTSPEIADEMRAAARPMSPTAGKKQRRKKKRKREEPASQRAPAPRRVIARPEDDPPLWKTLGVHQGPVILLEAALLRGDRDHHLVAAGFSRADGIPLAAILSRQGGTYRIHHLGVSCAGRPVDAHGVDFRFDSRAAVALYVRDGAEQRLVLLPFDPRQSGAKFIGGRYAGRNVFGCYPLGGKVKRIAFADVDHDRSMDLLIGYDTPHAGPAYDVYFQQGTDFYFRETRLGIPRE